MLPEFGSTVSHRAEACTPHELFSCLAVAPEEHAHLLEPAFLFAQSMLCAAEPPAPGVLGADAYVDRLITWAKAASQPLPPRATLGTLVMVAREFALTGLTDGAWLRGFALANAVESGVGMALLRQLMLRFGDPGSRESYAERYMELLQSLGVPPQPLLRVSWGGEAPCLPASYEQALLGLALGQFPSALGPEALGFNLWTVTLGPCPLLDRLAAGLRARGACLRYFDLYDRAALTPLARAAICQGSEQGEEEYLVRVGRGFVAAHTCYERWAQSVLLHAAGREPLPAAGRYTAPQDPESLTEFACSRYAELSNNELYYYLANADQNPAVQVFARAFSEQVFAKVSRALDTDERLNSRTPPPYSERTLAEIVAAQHAKNVRSRAGSPANGDAAESGKQNITQIFDGAWLQGFADVHRIQLEEYGWLFRIYASEHGDGDIAWNHCQIFRRAFADLGPDILLPKTDRRLYELFDIGTAALVTLAVSLNTRRFLPEILGINLAIEATGVGGTYLDQWKGAHERGNPWRALAWRLHNSIDNYADGHTKWSLAAVQAYLRRVGEASPAAVAEHWHRVWRPWRCQDILTHGTREERAALAEHLELTNLAPT